MCALEHPQTGNKVSTATLELLYHLNREFTEPLDLNDVLTRILSLSMKNVGGQRGTVVVLDNDGKEVEPFVFQKDPGQPASFIEFNLVPEKELVEWVIRNKQQRAILITDTRTDHRWSINPKEEVSDIRSVVCAPLVARDDLVGVLTLVHSTMGFFTPEHLLLIQSIADQAGSAVLNARLHRESQIQARLMTALIESGKSISGSLRLDDVLNNILEQVNQVLRAEGISLALIDHVSNELVFKAATGESANRIIGIRVPLGKGVIGWVAESGEGVVVPEVDRDPRFFAGIDERINFTTHSIACAPIKIEGEVIGVLEAVNPIDGRFDQSALMFLIGFGRFAGIAIKNAQLYEHLQQAHRSFRELFEDSIDPILITDFYGKIEMVNRRAVMTTLFDRKELLKMTIDQLHHVDYSAVGFQYSRLSSRETVDYEAEIWLRDRKNLPVEIYVRNVTVEGQPRIQWIMRDVSVRKKLDKLKEDLVSMIYHDMRSPLANVISSLDVLVHSYPSDDPTVQSVIEIARRSAERIQRLTSSLLDTNLLEAGQPVGNRIAADVVKIVESAIDANRQTLEVKDQTIKRIFTKPLPLINVDEDMIRRVLINLLDNANKFTPPKGVIQVGAKQVGEDIHIWVQDTGRGIPFESQPRIFEKFTRVNATGTTKGLGIGLAFCKLAIEGHGGKIWVESEEGKGSSFTISLPIKGREMSENPNKSFR